jgi:hypothetical protein
MSPVSISTGPCQQSTGFLFSHECGLPAAATCPRCGKRVCDAHLSALGGELVCTSCAETGEEEGADEESGGDAGSDVSEDDPSYYYRDYGYYGPGSAWAKDGGRDPNDFTEADGESLRHEEDASFEEDLGGS